MRAYWIDRVEMSEQEHRLSAASAGEIYLQVIAEILRPVKLRVPTKGFKSPGEEGAQLIYGLLVVGRRLDLHQLANSLDDLLFAVLEITRSVRDLALGNRVFKAFLGIRPFLKWLMARRTV